MKRVRNIVLIGMMGSGKSAVGGVLAGELGWLHQDLDDRVVAEAGASIPDIFAREGEEGFRDRETEALRSATARTQTVLSTGGGAVLREGNRALMRRWGLVVLLDADIACLARRLAGETAARPLLGNEKDLHGKLAELRQSRATFYQEAAHHVIDTGALTIDQVARRILKRATLDREEGPL